MLVEYLREEFGRRCRRNPSYSLRAFARSLKVDSSTLSSILNEKRRVSPRAAKRMLDELGTEPQAKQRIISSMLGLDAPGEEVPEYAALDPAVFEIIGSWEHFAILALLDTDDCKPSVSWISSRLDVGTGTVAAALSRLERVGLVRKAGQAWVTTGKSLATPSDLPDAAVRKNNRQYLEKAIDSLERHSVSERDITGITVAIDRKKLQEAKAMIRSFRRRLAQFLADGDSNGVYRINIQLFPLDQP